MGHGDVTPGHANLNFGRKDTASFTAGCVNTLRCPLAVHREVEQALSPVSTDALLLGPQRLSGLLPHVQGVVGHILLPLPAGGDRRNIAISAKAC